METDYYFWYSRAAWWRSKMKKVIFTLLQALKAQWESRVIALLFL